MQKIIVTALLLPIVAVEWGSCLEIKARKSMTIGIYIFKMNMMTVIITHPTPTMVKKLLCMSKERTG